MIWTTVSQHYDSPGRRLMQDENQAAEAREPEEPGLSMQGENRLNRAAQPEERRLLTSH
jgi:hypothetical protein